MPSPAAAPPAARTAAGIRPAFIARGAMLGTGIAIYLLVLFQTGLHQQDLQAYLSAGRDLLNGRPLYTGFLQHPFPDAALRPAFIYPPVFAMLISPLALLPPIVAGAVWLIITQAALAAAVGLVLRRFQASAWATAAVIAATATFYPVWVDMAQGQANLLVLLLVTIGILGVLDGRPHYSASIGAAAALKLTPALLLVWLLIERRFRAAAWLIGAFLAVSLAGALFRWQDSITFVTQVAPALATQTAYYANQSVTGVLGRLFSANPYTQPWLRLPAPALLPILASLVLLALWIWRTRALTSASRAAAFVPLLPLVSSITWPHHLVILLPLIWLILIELAAARWPLAPTLTLTALLAVFSVMARWPAGPPFGDPRFVLAQTADLGVLLTANAFFLGTLLLFLLAPWLLRSR